MARLARIVAPGLPHHLTQRGNRRAQLFFSDADYQAYLTRVQADAARRGLVVLAYCLMPNHVHLVAIPTTETALAATLRDTHTAYAVYRNRRDGTNGHVWQGRYFSCVLDDAHLWAAIRYVERNPERAGLVTAASDYRWSSAAAHAGLRTDPLLSPWPADPPVPPEAWAAWLAGEDVDTTETLRRRTHTGRPCGAPDFLRMLAARLGRPVAPGKRGRKSKAKHSVQATEHGIK